MNNRIAVAVVGHVNREHQAQALADDLDARLFLDDGTLGEIGNHHAAIAWLADQVEADPGIVWGCWLEDDAIPIADFEGSLKRALADAGDAIISLYLGRQRWAGTHRQTHAPIVEELVNKAKNEHASWIDGDGLWHAVGVAIPAKWLRAVAQHIDTTRVATDKAVGEWARNNGVQVRYTWPSIVDHADEAPTVPLSASRYVAGRVAWSAGTWTSSTKASDYER